MPCHPMKSQRRLQKISASISLVILTLGFSFLGLVSFVNKPHADLPKVTCVGEAAKTLTYHIERCTFPPWDGADGTLNIAFPTENELNITLTAPIQDPSLGPIFPHLSLKRAK